MLAPLVILIWLIPGFRDFSESAGKTYLSTIFVLFVHVVILKLASSLFAGMTTGSDSPAPDTLMSMIVGLATILTLFKAQGAMMQLSYVSMGARNTRKLGGQFMNGVSYMTGKGRLAAATVSAGTQTAKNARLMKATEARAVKTGQVQSISYQDKKGTANIFHTAVPTKSKATTGSMQPQPITARPSFDASKVHVTRVNNHQSTRKDKTP